MDEQGTTRERYEGPPVGKERAPAFAFKVSPVKEGALLGAAVVAVLYGYLMEAVS